MKLENQLVEDKILVTEYFENQIRKFYVYLSGEEWTESSNVLAFRTASASDDSILQINFLVQSSREPSKDEIMPEGYYTFYARKIDIRSSNYNRAE
jgi:hypothetical protein